MELGKPLAVEETPIPGFLRIDLTVHGDNRGWFKENWQREKMLALGLPDFGPVQNNISFNNEVGVTRGIHAEPWDKFVSVATGRVFGAWVDLREGPSFGAVYTCEIDPSVAVFVPRGVGNSYQTLEPNTAYTYLVNDHWSADARYTFLNLADETVNVPWPIALSEAILSDKVHELAEGPLDVLERAVVIEMVGLDVGHDDHIGIEVEKGAVRLVGLADEVLPRSVSAIGTILLDNPTYEEGGVASEMVEHGRDHGRGSGLAVRAGNGDALAEAHNLRQHHGARNYRNACLAGSQHFRIIRLDGGGGNHHVHAFDMLCRMAVKHLDAHIGQLARYRALCLIRAGYVEFFIQHLGQAAHARATDTDEMNAFYSLLHIYHFYHCFPGSHCRQNCYCIADKHFLIQHEREKSPYCC